MPNRNKRSRDKDRFIFTTDLNFIKPYVEYHMCIENYISRFKPNDIILYNRNIGFALINYKDFCPIDILNDPYCLDYVYINENYRGKGHCRRLLNLIIKHFQVIIHSLDESLGFFEHISKDFGLEKIKTNMPYGVTFISTNLNINRKPITNICLGACGLEYSGYKRYVCASCYIQFAKYNINHKLIDLNKDLRSKLNIIQPSIIFANTGKPLLEILYNNNNDIDYQRSDLDEMYIAKRMMQLYLY